MVEVLVWWCLEICFHLMGLSKVAGDVCVIGF